MAKQIVVSGGFENLKSIDVRFLEEAAQAGDLTVLVWSDAVVAQVTGAPPKFPLAERRYFLEAIRYVSAVQEVQQLADANSLPALTTVAPEIWMVPGTQANAAKESFCAAAGLEYRVLSAEKLHGFPAGPEVVPATPGRKKVVVTGCYDWFHTGHVRFFEEVHAYGDVYAVVGHDANIRLLKGEGHPQFPEAERRYMVGAVRFVKQALISSGNGWLDAEPEIQRIQPDIYAVNEDGDRPEKRAYCEKAGIEYLVLKRTPAPGLPKRTSTDLRGF